MVAFLCRFHIRQKCFDTTTQISEIVHIMVLHEVILCSLQTLHINLIGSIAHLCHIVGHLGSVSKVEVTRSKVLQIKDIGSITSAFETLPLLGRGCASGIAPLGQRLVSGTRLDANITG